MQKIVPFLWFDNQAEEAANFYVSVFNNSRILSVSHYGEAGQEVTGQKPGTVMTVEFELEGQHFSALNGGPLFKFSEAISFLVNVETQEELDAIWNKLSAVPEAEQCGWLKDKYGLSWQIVPPILEELMKGSDPKKSAAVMNTMLKMKKIDIAGLQQAYDQA